MFFFLLSCQCPMSTRFPAVGSPCHYSLAYFDQMIFQNSVGGVMFSIQPLHQKKMCFHVLHMLPRGITASLNDTHQFRSFFFLFLHRMSFPHGRLADDS